ncbi:MAG: long-chain-fatty-acid--CoA ligase [Chloroflexota bacterium]
MNVAHTIERGRREYPRKPALIFENTTMSYADLDICASRMANGLHGLDVGVGDRVALWLPNSFAFVFCYFGILKIGAVAVSLNTMLKRGEATFILNDSEATILITTTELRDMLDPTDLPSLRQTILVDAPGDGLFLNNVLEQSSPDRVARSMHKNDPAALLYTSGTTGTPKGALLSHGNVEFNSVAKVHHCGTTPQDKLALFLPLFHCYGQNAILNHGLHAGATIVLQQRFDPEQVVQAIVQHSITVLFGVPTVFIKLLQVDVDPEALRSVRYCFTASAPMPLDVSLEWRERYSTVIHEGYGMTETSPFASYNHPHHWKAGSIGIPIDGVQMDVVDANGHVVGPGATGEIVIRGPNVMLGYWRRPDATAYALRQGWLHTGDVGYIDDEGYFHIVDRLKDMINVSGFKVYPAEIERMLRAHPAVGEVAVFALPDPIKGEAVASHIILNQGHTAESEELLSFCREHMANFKVPKHIQFVKDFPKNATGKVLKHVLRAQYSHMRGNSL